MAEVITLNISDDFEKRIKDADGLIKNLATNSEKASKDIISAFKDMGNTGVDFFIGKLQEAKTKLKSLSNVSVDINWASAIQNSASKSIDDVNGLIQVLSKLSSAHLQTLATMQESVVYKKMLNDLKSLKNEENERTRELTRQNKQNIADNKVYAEQIKTSTLEQIAGEKRKQAEIKRTITEINRLAKAYKQMPTALTSKNVGTIIAQTMGASTINQHLTAISNLKNAIKDLDSNQKNYDSTLKKLNSEIERHKKALNDAGVYVDKVKKRQSSLMDTTSQLQRKLALVFSISQIQGYINTLVKVRGEFKLQQKSLQILLQDKDNADKLWQRTVDLAVKSPFRVKELVTYTRQLAAYRIENEKLFDTTRRLSDVSAGLGVDMQRIILAYGQVKAANFLRGTELRQFTEAGIPMLDELAKHFTELNNRMVSAGDVFEMISKRMVSFSDVEKVFQRMTDAGGVFYKMQEEQSKTLSGMISNLHDSIDLMLNDIGKAHESTLKGAIDYAKKLVENWEAMKVVLEQVTFAVAINGLFNLKRGFMSTGKALTFAATEGKGFIKVGARLNLLLTSILRQLIAHPWIALGSAIAMAGYSMYQFYLNTTKTKRELEQIERQGWFDATHSVTEFKNLANTISDATKSTEEQASALSILKTKYQDILPDAMLTIENIKEMDGNYKKATDTIYEYIAAKTKEKQLDKIESIYNKKVISAEESLSIALQKTISKAFGGVEVTSAQVQPIIDELKQGLADGAINADSYKDKVKEIIKLHTGLDIVLQDNIQMSTSMFGSMSVDANNVAASTRMLVSSLAEMNNAIDNVNKRKVDFGSLAIPELNEIKEGYKEIADNINIWIETLRKSPDNVEALDNLNSIFINAKQKAPEWNKIINDPFKLNEAVIKANEILWSKMIEEVSSKKVVVTALPAKQQFIETLQKELSNFSGDRLQQEINGIILKLSNQYNVTTQGLDKLFKQSTESLNDYAEKVKSLLTSMETDVAQFNNDVKYGINLSPFAQEQIDRTKQQIPLVTALLEMLQVYLKKTPENKGKNWFSEIVNSVQEAHKEYIKLSKTLDEASSKQLTLAKYSKLFSEAVKNANIGDISLGKLTFETEQGVIDALTLLKDKLPANAKEAHFKIEKALSEITGEVRIKTKTESDKEIIHQIEDMFNDYEISLELQKLNIPPDLAKQLFGVELTDLKLIRKEIEDKIKSALAKGSQEDLVKDLQKQLEKVEEMEDKALKERLKKYSKYLTTAMGERVKIKMEEIRAISEIENTKEFTDDQKELAKQGVRKESQAKLDKLEWEEFKDSGLYVQLFEDLEYASTKSLKAMREQLIALKGSLKNLDADDLKHLYNQIEKLDDVIAKRNPFKTFINGLDDYRNAVKSTKHLDDNLANKQDEYNKAKQIETNIDLKLAKYREEYNQKSKNNKLSKQENDTYLYNISLLESQLRIAREATKMKKEGVEQAQKEVDTNNKIKKFFQESGGEVGKYISQAANAIPQIAESMENVFGTMDAKTRDTIDSIAEIGGGIGDTVQAIANKDVIGTLVGLAKTIGAIAAIGDKKKERQIQREIESVDKLSKAYERLQKKIEDAYSISTLQGSGQKAKKNLESQIAAYERMIQAEEAKKKTDKKRIEEWRDSIDDLKEQISELSEDLVSTATAGIMDSVLSASQEFTNAWLEAFRETGDGLSGLESNFKETMLEMVKQQAAMLISQSYVEKWKKQLEQYINIDDLELTTKEARLWVNSVTTSLPQLNDALEKYFTAMQAAGVDLSGGTGDLSGLQRGIQGVTEETAHVIEAYLNSIRFFVSEQNTYLAQIASTFNSGEMENPMVSQLRIIAQQTTDIHTLLNSLVKGGHSLGGYGMKVFIS